METKAKNKTQLAYEYILSRIENGVYGPGYRVVIDQIARELGLSSIPVREAIR
ncbi:GntR family transcriptional regulator, partial [Geobacillus sp. WSUCF1]